MMYYYVIVCVVVIATARMITDRNEPLGQESADRLVVAAGHTITTRLEKLVTSEAN